MKKHLVVVAVLWLVLTAVGQLLVGYSLFPTWHSNKGDHVQEAYDVLMRLGIPVFSFVVAAMLYSVIAFRRKGPPTEDGPAFFGRNIPKVWLAITATLAIVTILYPGVSGTKAVLTDEPGTPDLVVELTGARWYWIAKYPDSGVQSLAELVLPAGKNIRLETTAADVIHSMWIPSFGLKIDSVPGMTTHLSFRTKGPASYLDDDSVRLQCAELCGRDHATMMLPVRVVPEAEFKAWLDAQPNSKPKNVEQPTPVAATDGLSRQR